MPTLVTGATGFVGRHLVDELLGRGTLVRALIRDPGKAESLRQRGVEVVVGDVRQVPVLREAVRGVELIYHCAAASSFCATEEIRQTNVAGVRSLLEAVRCEHAGRVVLLSSLNVLGSRSFDGATEDRPRQCSGEAHADAKFDMEELTERYARQYGLDVVILRPGLIYGPGERHLPTLARAIQRGKFSFIGSRHNLIPLVYIDDMIQALCLAAEKGRAGRIYHVTDGSRTTIGDLVDVLADLMRCPRPTKRLPYVVPWLACTICRLLGTPGPISRTSLRFVGTSRFVDSQRAREELGYAPQVVLREGLEKTAPWLARQELVASATS